MSAEATAAATRSSATTTVASSGSVSGGKAPRAVQQVRDASHALAAAGQVSDALELCLAALTGVVRQCQDLELLVAKLRRERAASQSERVDPAQLRLLLDQMEGRAAPVVPDLVDEAQEDANLEQARRDAEAAHAGQEAGKKRKKARRRGLGTGPNVEKRIHKVEVAEAARICGICGTVRPGIGADITHRLEWVPGHFVDNEYHLAKHAGCECEEGVTTAPAPLQVIPRSPADASLIAQVIVSKYVDHQPFHRIHDGFARNGATIPVSTMSDWVGTSAKILVPVVDCLAQRILAAYVVRIDGTGMPVLDRNSPLNIARGTMWGCVGDDRDVLFLYRPTGKGIIGPWDILKDRKGYIQADAANVFDRLYNGRAASGTEIGCWSHGRRRLVKLKDSDCRVAWPLLLISRLYRIERLADAQRLSFDDRRALRQERSAPVLDKIRDWLVPTVAMEPPSSDLAKAASYIVNQWQALTRFLQDGRLDLDNNLCERQMRAIALGRRNYLFCGSHEAAAHAAVFYSLTRTCALHGIPPLTYLTDVLRKLAGGWLQSRIEELLPGRWSPG